MAKMTLTERVQHFVDSEMAGNADPADVAKALKVGAAKILATQKPTPPAKPDGELSAAAKSTRSRRAVRKAATAAE